MSPEQQSKKWVPGEKLVYAGILIGGPGLVIFASNALSYTIEGHGDAALTYAGIAATGIGAECLRRAVPEILNSESQ